MRRTTALLAAGAVAVGAMGCGDAASSDATAPPTPTSLVDPVETTQLAPGADGETGSLPEAGNGTGGGDGDERG
jgi:ABC-type glycerol-3-phosphate transport system substrate-binding protein